MMKYVSLFLAILIQNFEVASQSAEQLIEQANLSLANRDVNQSIALCNTLLQLTSVEDNYYLEAWSILGDAYLRVGLYDSSYQYNQKILGYTGSERSKEQLYKASNFIGFYHIVHGNLDSTRYYANSVIASEESNNYHSMDSLLVTGLSDAHYLLAIVHRTRGLLDSCVNEFQRSLLIKEEAFGKRSQAVIPSIREIAATFRYDSQYDSALKYIRRALELDQKYQNQSPSLYYEAGVIYSLNLQYRKGLDYFEYALDIREKNNFPADINGCTR